MAAIRVQTGLRLDEEAYMKISLIAQVEKRSLNAQIEYAVEQIITQFERENGVIKVEPK